MTVERTYPRWQRGDREYAILEALAEELISIGKAVELFFEGGEPPLVEHGVLLGGFEELPPNRPDPAMVFAPFWPPALEAMNPYQVPCDDKGRNGGSFLQVLIAQDGDVHVSAQEWEDFPEGDPSPFPSVRIRTGIGGGRNMRTRQALLWLAEAIRLDTEENAP